MNKGSMIRVHIGQDRHGHGGFVAMGKVVDENDHMLVMDLAGFLLIKNEVGSIEELPEDSVLAEALRIVQVGRESYLGKTSPLKIQSVVIAPSEK